LDEFEFLSTVFAGALDCSLNAFLAASFASGVE
jgi:hypothetical protein